jgi:FkbM family methyltransferase
MRHVALKKIIMILISRALDIFDLKTKIRLCRILFGDKANGILFLGGARVLDWHSLAFAKPIKFILNTDDDYFSLFVKQIEGLWERETLAEWTTIAETADIVIDVGAYFGLFTNAAAMTLGPNKIISIEPNFVVFQKLLLHLNANQTMAKVRPVNVAISEKEGEALLMVPKDRVTSSGAQLGDSDLGNMDQNWMVCNSIKTATLDSLVPQEELSRITQIKIDVEGYEKQVLLSASKILTSSRPHLFIEILSTKSLQEIQKILGKYNYLPPKPLDGKMLNLENPNAILDMSLARNYLFSPHQVKPIVAP